MTSPTQPIDAHETSIAAEASPEAVHAGPATRIIIGSIGTQRVRIGSDLNVSCAAMLLDKDGQTVSGGTAVWSVSAAPQPDTGISVTREDQMNGRIRSSVIKRSHNVTLRVSTTQYPNLTASLPFEIIAV